MDEIACGVLPDTELAPLVRRGEKLLRLLSGSNKCSDVVSSSLRRQKIVPQFNLYLHERTTNAIELLVNNQEQNKTGSHPTVLRTRSTDVFGHTSSRTNYLKFGPMARVQRLVNSVGFEVGFLFEILWTFKSKVLSSLTCLPYTNFIIYFRIVGIVKVIIATAMAVMVIAVSFTVLLLLLLCCWYGYCLLSY